MAVDRAGDAHRAPAGRDQRRARPLLLLAGAAMLVPFAAACLGKLAAAAVLGTTAIRFALTACTNSPPTTHSGTSPAWSACCWRWRCTRYGGAGPRRRGRSGYPIGRTVTAPWLRPDTATARTGRASRPGYAQRFDGDPGALEGCYDALTDYERLPSWQHAVRSATVLERVRPRTGTVVEYEVDAKLKRMRYRLRQAYDAGPAWLQYLGAGFRHFCGWRLVVSGRARVSRLELRIDVGGVPRPVRAAIAHAVMSCALADRKRHLEAELEAVDGGLRARSRQERSTIRGRDSPRSFGTVPVDLAAMWLQLGEERRTASLLSR